MSPKSSEDNTGKDVTTWDKSCHGVEEGEHGPWVGTLEADGNLDSRV